MSSVQWSTLTSMTPALLSVWAPVARLALDLTTVMGCVFSCTYGWHCYTDGVWSSPLVAEVVSLDQLPSISDPAVETARKILLSQMRGPWLQKLLQRLLVSLFSPLLGTLRELPNQASSWASSTMIDNRSSLCVMSCIPTCFFQIHT